MKKQSVTFEQFMSMDFRVGKVINATVVPSSRKLLELSVDLGEDYGIVTIFSGIAKEYKPEDIVNKNFPFLANLEPKKNGRG